MPPILAHAFDIETSSRKIGNNRLMSIGAVVLEISKHRTEIIHRFFEVIEWDGGLDMSDESTARFWSEFPEQFKASTVGGKPPAVVAKALMEHIKEIQNLAIRRKCKYVQVFDNTYFDVPWIDWFLCTHGPPEALPLRHNYLTGWMTREHMVSVTERIEALREIKCAPPPFKASFTNTHHPVDDAAAIAERYAHYLDHCRILRRSARES